MPPRSGPKLPVGTSPSIGVAAGGRARVSRLVGIPLFLFVASGIGVLAVVIAMVTGGSASQGGDIDKLRNVETTAAPRPAPTLNDDPYPTNQEIFVINTDGSTSRT